MVQWDMPIPTSYKEIYFISSSLVIIVAIYGRSGINRLA